MPTLEAVPEDWNRALAVVAHPDDLEFGAASAVARWTAQGKDIAYCLVTVGEAGIDGMDPQRSAVVRREEQVRSAAVVGVEEVSFLGHPDGLVQPTLELRRDLAAAIRDHRPEVLISLNFRDTFGGDSLNHVDHRVVGATLIDATRDAANRWLFPGAGGEPWSGVRFGLFSGSPRAAHAVDVTDTLDRGVASLARHAAYLDGLPDDNWARDPEAFLRSMATGAGERLGVELATAFELIPL